eukprot:COSAG01_NODE_3840_length_5646_cov_13.756805_3_plen_87_part_00
MRMISVTQMAISVLANTTAALHAEHWHGMQHRPARAQHAALPRCHHRCHHSTHCVDCGSALLGDDRTGHGAVPLILVVNSRFLHTC